MKNIIYIIFRKILVDTGEPNVDEYINKLKEALGDGEIDAIIATHWHHDHVGGIDNVRKMIGNDVPIYKFKRQDTSDERTDYKYVEDGHELTVDGATIRLVLTISMIKV